MTRAAAKTLNWKQHAIKYRELWANHTCLQKLYDDNCRNWLSPRIGTPLLFCLNLESMSKEAMWPSVVAVPGPPSVFPFVPDLPKAIARAPKLSKTDLAEMVKTLEVERKPQGIIHETLHRSWFKHFSWPTLLASRHSLPIKLSLSHLTDRVQRVIQQFK